MSRYTSLSPDVVVPPAPPALATTRSSFSEQTSNPSGITVNKSAQTVSTTPPKTTHSTTYWIVIAIIVIIVIILIIAAIWWFFSRPAVPIPLPVQSSTGVLFNSVLTQAGNQAITPVGNTLLIVSGATAVTINSSNNPVGSILGIKNTGTTNITVSGPGLSGTAPASTIPAGGYGEFVVASSGSYLRLI